MHTKAAQVCAHLLGIPLDLVSVKSTNNLVNPNGNFSGGSITSELVVKVRSIPTFLNQNPANLVKYYLFKKLYYNKRALLVLARS